MINDQVKKWSGEGLPPVGIECEYKDTGEHAFIVAHHANGLQAIWSTSPDSGTLFYGTTDDFRPIRTDRDQWIEMAEHAIEENDLNPANSEHLGIIYDIGLARLPEAPK